MNTMSPDALAQRSARLLTRAQKQELEAIIGRLARLVDETGVHPNLAGNGSLAARAALDAIPVLRAAFHEDTATRVALNNAETHMEDRRWGTYDPSA